MSFASIPDRILLPALIAAGIILLLVLLLIIRRIREPLPVRMERKIRRRRYYSKERFFETWKNSKKDYPGCYVILIYDKRLILNPLHYDEIYVGQSVHVRHRVFSHLMGHGNGNVYFGLKSGCKICVAIKRCGRKKLNRAEKELIRYFNATSSLNMTRGGSAKH